MTTQTDRLKLKDGRIAIGAILIVLYVAGLISTSNPLWAIEMFDGFLSAIGDLWRSTI